MLQGICTHVSDVKPHILVATYTDAETGYEVYQQVTGKFLSHIFSEVTLSADHRVSSPLC